MGCTRVITWGKGELEDLLFDPLNDHLLFAYFGVSLQVRRRSATADLQRRLTRKRQLYTRIAGLDSRGSTPVLLRDPTELGYPFADDVVEPDSEYPAWLWTGYDPHSRPEEVALVFRRHHAWLNEDRTGYDVLDGCSHVVPYRNGFEYVLDRDEALCERAWGYFYNAVPREQRAWVSHVGFIPIDAILLVDDLGDAVHEPPHLLAVRDQQYGYFSRIVVLLEPEDQGAGPLAQPAEPIKADDLQKVKLFPEPIPETEWRGPGSALRRSPGP